MNWRRLFGRKPATAAAPRPVVFVDIDGVLAPLAMRTGLVEAYVGGWQGTIVYDPQVIAYLKRWHETGLAEVRWLTSWDEEANSCFAPAVGLPEFYVHPEPTIGNRLGSWKVALVCHHLYETKRPVAWLEDEDSDDPAAQRVAQAEPHRALIIKPDARVGVTVEDCLRVEAFLRRNG